MRGIVAVQAIARDERRQVLAADLRRFRLEDAVENSWKLVATPRADRG